MNSIEYDLGPSDKLYFLHIQKTAGTTFYFTLDEKFDPEDICPARFWRQFLRLAKDDITRLRKYRLFRGHFGYSVPKFLKTTPVVVTVLRDPIQRSISHFEHICREPKDRRHKLVKTHNMSLVDFVKHPETRLAVHNLQTRSIAFDLGQKDIRKMRGFAAQGVIGTPALYPDEELLHLAQTRLHEFPFVGLVERFQASLFLLSYIFGWYPIRQTQELNKAPKKTRQSDLTEEALDLLVEANQLDSQLYEQAQQRFDQQFDQMVKALWDSYGDRATLPKPPAPEQVNDDLLFNWLVQHYETRAQQRQPEPLQIIDFPFCKAISGSGWHLREGSGSGWHLPGGLDEGGTPFRWTGPDTTSILDFPLAKTADLNLKLRIINAAAPDILDSLTLTVNDHPVELDASIRQGTLAVLQGTISQSMLAGDRAFTRLTFTVNRTASVTPDGTDPRLVGLAFHRLQLFPESMELSDEDFTHYVFPNDDPYWVQVADFVGTYLRPQETLVAPGEFSKRFPKQLRSQTPGFSNRPQLSWVIIHKGMVQDMDLPSLRWAVKTMRLVFSNAVFTVLSNREDVPQGSRLSKDWLILQVQMLLLELEHRHVLSPTFRNTVFRLSKALYKRTRSLIDDDSKDA